MSDTHSLSSEQVVTGCEWEPDEDGIWNTGCGKSFVLNEGGPIENGMRFCCYCGLALDELPYEEPEDDDDDPDRAYEQARDDAAHWAQYGEQFDD